MSTLELRESGICGDSTSFGSLPLAPNKKLFVFFWHQESNSGPRACWPGLCCWAMSLAPNVKFFKRPVWSRQKAQKSLWWISLNRNKKKFLITSERAFKKSRTIIQIEKVLESLLLKLRYKTRILLLLALFNMVLGLLTSMVEHVKRYMKVRNDEIKLPLLIDIMFYAQLSFPLYKPETNY